MFFSKYFFPCFFVPLFFLNPAHAQIPVVELEVGPSPVYELKTAKGAPAAFDSDGDTGSDWPEGYIAISIDDGPNKKYTQKVLDILKKYNVRATFFLVGYVAELYPTLVQAIHNDNHTIGTHTLRHASLKSMPVDKAMVQIREGIRLVTNALGQAPAPLFRFPFLDSNPAIRTAVANEGLAQISWSGVQLGSNLAPDAKGHLKKGVLITHDTHDSILWALPSFLDQMEKYGYTAVVLVPKK